jgi:hypothetical protein
VRHSKRCLANVRSVPRQKSCEQCIRAKSRCTLTRPECERCLTKGLSCHYFSRQYGNHGNNKKNSIEFPKPSTLDSLSTLSIPKNLAPANVNDGSTPVSPKLQSPVDLGPMGRYPGLIQRAGSIEQHALQHTIRVLRTYPRMLSTGTQVPPFIHHYQIEKGVLPPALKTCYSILTENKHNPDSLQEQITKEIANLNKTVGAILPFQGSSWTLIRRRKH